jgi:hypothetical protein
VAWEASEATGSSAYWSAALCRGLAASYQHTFSQVPEPSGEGSGRCSQALLPQSLLPRADARGAHHEDHGEMDQVSVPVQSWGSPDREALLPYLLNQSASAHWDTCSPRLGQAVGGPRVPCL